MNDQFPNASCMIHDKGCDKNYNTDYYFITIIKKGRQCKAERE